MSETVPVTFHATPNLVRKIEATAIRDGFKSVGQFLNRAVYAACQNSQLGKPIIRGGL